LFAKAQTIFTPLCGNSRIKVYKKAREPLLPCCSCRRRRVIIARAACDLLFFSIQLSWEIIIYTARRVLSVALGRARTHVCSNGIDRCIFSFFVRRESYATGTCHTSGKVNEWVEICAGNRANLVLFENESESGSLATNQIVSGAFAATFCERLGPEQ
jgi:hypothetical protein